MPPMCEYMFYSAINHQNFSENSIHPIDSDLKASSDHVLELLRTRRSIRAFNDKKVPKMYLEKIINAANFAPSAKNKQTTEYIIVQDKNTLEAIVKITLIL